MSDLNISGGTRALDPRRQGRTFLKTLKDPSGSDVGAALLGHTGQHNIAEALSEEKQRKTAEAVAEQVALEEAQKQESLRKETEAKRKQRKAAGARKGRRASILTSPLGATGEATVRRPTLG